MQDEIKCLIKESVAANMGELKSIRTYLYENPEVGGEEAKAFELLTITMKEHGFNVTTDFHNIDYCFKAEYDSGREGAVIGITAEYDALPEIGHGCGHNIISAAALGAAFALKEVVAQTGGKVMLFGTPAEENFVSKVQLSDEGAFDEADVVMTVHPSPENYASGKTNVMDALQVEFFGKAAHAGANPEDGINALDAAVHFYTLIGFEKQYLKGANIYGIFDDGGQKCSIIPDHASLKYVLRAGTLKETEKIRAVFERCAEAAAEAVGATYKISRYEPINLNMVTNRTISGVFNKYYEELACCKMEYRDSTASTDMGNVSHVVPAIHPWIGLECPDLMLHSREFAEVTVTAAGDAAIRNGAQALAMTGAEILSSPELLAEIKAEFEEAKTGF